MPDEQPVRVRRPASDTIDSTVLSRVAVIGIVILIVVGGLTMGLLDQFRTDLPRGTRRISPQEANQMFAAPRLEPAPATEISQLRREKDPLLQQYQWVDREHGVVRIPVEQAMARLAQHPEMQK